MGMSKDTTAVPPAITPTDAGSQLEQAVLAAATHFRKRFPVCGSEPSPTDLQADIMSAFLIEQGVVTTTDKTALQAVIEPVLIDCRSRFVAAFAAGHKELGRSINVNAEVAAAIVAAGLAQ